MIADQIDEPLTDDEWREEKFTEDQLAAARYGERFGKVSLKQLKDALTKNGPDGILESAIMLPRTQYEELEKLVRRAPQPRSIRRRSRS